MTKNKLLALTKKQTPRNDGRKMLLAIKKVGMSPPNNFVVIARKAQPDVAISCGNHFST